MASIFFSPVFQFANSAGQPYAGGSLTFLATNSSAPQDTFSDAALAIPNTNPVVLNSAGWPATAIFLQNLPYKVILKDVLGNEIWTRDPVSTTDFASVPIMDEVVGNPNGQLAGTAASSGVLPSLAWDRVNNILYVCTTTGNAATAVWTAINASAATPTVSAPQGYLTPTSGTPIIAGDVSAATSIHYEPFTGDLVPIYNGSRMIPTEFSPLTLDLVSQHALNTLYDVFVYNNSGVLSLVTGPAWSVSAAGTGARGTGAGTTQITRLNGYWVNAVSMTGRNGAETPTIGANLATYLGSIFIDGTAGQVTCHRAWGQSRKWGVWNAYNRQPLYLKAGDPTASWSYNTATIRASNGNIANSLTVFQGLAEEFYDLEFSQYVEFAGTTSIKADNGIGWNSATAMSGHLGSLASLFNGEDVGANIRATYLQVPALGINVVTALENAVDPANTSMTWSGGEDDMVLSAKWRG